MLSLDRLENDGNILTKTVKMLALIRWIWAILSEKIDHNTNKWTNTLLRRQTARASAKFGKVCSRNRKWKIDDAHLKGRFRSWKFRGLVRVARFSFVQCTKICKNTPNDHKIYQMVKSYTKQLQNGDVIGQNVSFQGLSDNQKLRFFGMKIFHLATLGLVWYLEEGCFGFFSFQSSNSVNIDTTPF
jgi:hypothetical protein